MITETLPVAEPEPAASRLRRRRLLVLAVVVSLVLAAVGARALWPNHGPDVRDGTTVVTTEEMAARYGISITMIGVTAAGGMIDFRFQVVDPDKAQQVLHDQGILPVIVVEATGETLVLAAPPHHHNTAMELGGSYFFLFANAHNAVKPGASLTLVVGDARLEHVVAQG